MTIEKITFHPAQYLTVKKQIRTSHIKDVEMYDHAYAKLHGYLTKNKIQATGPITILYFKWNEFCGTAEIGVAFPVFGLLRVEDSDLILVNIPKSRAAMAVLKGSYDDLNATHQALMRYISQNKLNNNNVPVFALEEYAVSPMTEHNPHSLVTNLYYPYFKKVV